MANFRRKTSLQLPVETNTSELCASRTKKPTLFKQSPASRHWFFRRATEQAHLCSTLLIPDCFFEPTTTLYKYCLKDMSVLGDNSYTSACTAHGTYFQFFLVTDQHEHSCITNLLCVQQKRPFQPRRSGNRGRLGWELGGKKDDDNCGIDCMTQVNIFLWGFYFLDGMKRRRASFCRIGDFAGANVSA